MSETRPSPWRATAAKWASVIAMGMLTAYSAHPLFTVLLQLADDMTQSVGSNFATLMLIGLFVVFGGTAVALLPKATAALRVELGCRWSGILLWLTVPVMVVIVWLQAATETGADQGGATAAFFMLLIFGGYCAIIGSVLLLAATIIRRRRLAAPAP